MRISRPLKPGDGGKIDWLNLSVLFLVFFFNLVNQIHLEKSIMERVLYTGPFLFMILLVVIFKGNRCFKSLIYLLIAIGTTLDPANMSDYSGSIFFIYSFHIIRKPGYAVFVSVASIACLTVRSIILVDTVPGTLIMIAVFAYIYAIYYFLIFKPTSVHPKVKIKSLSDKENKLLTLIGDGLTHKEAAYEMKITHTEASGIIKKIKKKTGYKTLNQLYRDL